MARTRNVGEWPPVTSVYNPADYTSDAVDEGASDASRRAARGRVELSDLDANGRRRWRNYSMHEVDITVANGESIVVADCNFSFSKIRVHGIGFVEFRDCNLSKCRYRSVDPIAGAVLTFVRCNLNLALGD